VYQLRRTDPVIDPRGVSIAIVIPHGATLDPDEPLDVAVIELLTELHGDAGERARTPERHVTTAGGVDVMTVHLPPPWPTDIPRPIIESFRPDPALAEWLAAMPTGADANAAECRRLRADS
jgi:hypothetical protein